MNVYYKTFASTGRISHYLTAVQLYSGKLAIGTRSYSGTEFEANINYPLFEDQTEADKYLRDNFEEV